MFFWKKRFILKGYFRNFLMYLSRGMGDKRIKMILKGKRIFERTTAKGMTSGRSRPRQNAKKSIDTTAFCYIGKPTPQNLIKPAVYEGSQSYFHEKEAKSLEKHSVYKVSVLPIAGAAKPYKTLVKTYFAQVQNCTAQTLIKHAVYGGFLR